MNLANKIEKLYDTVPGRTKAIEHNRKDSFNSYISKIKNNPPINLELETLDNYKHKQELSTLFTYSPLKELKKELGDDILLWTWNNNGWTEESEKLLEAYHKISGINKNHMEKARYFLWRTLHRNETSIIKKSYNTLNSLNDFLKNYDIKGNILKNIKDGCSVSESKLEKYSLSQFNTKENYHIGTEKTWGKFKEIEGELNPDLRESFNIYIDSPISIGLMFNSEPCAVSSVFQISKDSLLINQFQGSNKRTYEYVESEHKYKEIKRKSQRAIIAINQNKIAFDFWNEYAKKQGFKKIGIESSENNKWVKEKYEDGKPHLELKSAIKNYDNLAISLGMEKEKDGNFYTEII